MRQPQVQRLAGEHGGVVGVVAAHSRLHKVVGLAKGLHHGQALQGLSHQTDQRATGGGAVHLELGGSGQVERKHDEGHDQQHAGEDGEVVDGGGHGDDGGQDNQAVDAQVVQSIDQGLIHDVSLLGKRQQQLTHRVLEEEAQRSVHDVVDGLGQQSLAGAMGPLEEQPAAEVHGDEEEQHGDGVNNDVGLGRVQIFEGEVRTGARRVTGVHVRAVPLLGIRGPLAQPPVGDLAGGLAGQEDDEVQDEDGAPQRAALDVGPHGLSQVLGRLLLLGLACLIGDVGGAQLQGAGGLLGGALLGGVTGLLSGAGSGQQVGGGQHLGQLLTGALVPGAEVDHVATVHDGDLVALGQELDLVGDQDHSLVAHQAAQAVAKDVVGGVVVHGGQRVVQQHQVGLGVGGAREVQALALAARQVDAAQASHGVVTLGQNLKVKLQGAGVDDGRVLVLVHLGAKQDGVTQRQVLAPGVLGHVRDAAAGHSLTSLLLHVAQDGGDEGGLAGTHAASDSHQLAGGHGELGHVQREGVRVGVLELGVADADTGGVGHGLALRHLSQQVCLDALNGRHGVGGSAHGLGQHHQGKAQDVEQGEDGEGQGGGQALAGVHLVGGEDDQGGDGGSGEYHHDLDVLDHVDAGLDLQLTLADLGHLAHEELLPGVVLDQLHGRQQLLEVGTALLGVGNVLLLGLDDEVAEDVLQGHDHKHHAPAGQRPFLDQDHQDGQNGSCLNGGSPQVVDVLDAVKDLVDVRCDKGHRIRRHLLGDGGHAKGLAADAVDQGSAHRDTNCHAAVRHALQRNTKDVGVNEEEDSQDPALVVGLPLPVAVHVELQGAHEEERAHDDADGPNQLEETSQHELLAPGLDEGRAQVGLARGNRRLPVADERIVAGLGLLLRRQHQGLSGNWALARHGDNRVHPCEAILGEEARGLVSFPTRLIFLHRAHGTTVSR
mmetsp:Transcript_17442/g.43894  ORF Transcript_17442/g.43894 Transcript_17442/m.43894 type:complete len:940 (-) Transcript_17442:126-2945(-)